MLKPALETHNVDGILVGEFWDCLRLDPRRFRICAALTRSTCRMGGRPEVAVDLSGVAFAGSAALGNFVALHRAARQRGGRLVLCNVDPTVREVLRASKLDVFFEFAGDRADALRVIKETPPAPAAATDGDHQGATPGSAPRERPALAPRSGPAPLRRRPRDPGAT